MGDVVRLYPRPTRDQVEALWEAYRAAKQLSMDEPTADNIRAAARAWEEFFAAFRRMR